MCVLTTAESRAKIRVVKYTIKLCHEGYNMSCFCFVTFVCLWCSLVLVLLHLALCLVLVLNLPLFILENKFC